MFRIYRVLKGEHLPCGCAVGVYERYDGVVVRLLDVRGLACFRADHRVGAIVRPQDGPAVPGAREGRMIGPSDGPGLSA